MSEIAVTIAGGWLLGVIFTAFRIPLPVPPLLGLLAAGAVLAGQFSYVYIARALLGR